MQFTLIQNLRRSMRRNHATRVLKYALAECHGAGSPALVQRLHELLDWWTGAQERPRSWEPDPARVLTDPIEHCKALARSLTAGAPRSAAMIRALIARVETLEEGGRP